MNVEVAVAGLTAVFPVRPPVDMPDISRYAAVVANHQIASRVIEAADHVRRVPFWLSIYVAFAGFL